MAGQQDFVHIFDVPADESAKQQLLGFIRELKGEIKEFSAISLFGKNVNSAAEFKQSSAEMEAALKRITELEKQLTKVREDGRRSNKQKTDEELRASIQQREETKARTDEIKAEGDAYKQLSLQYRQAAAEAKRLQAAALASGLKADADAADVAAKAAKGLSDELKRIDKTVGDNRRNVGNYGEAFAEPLKFLQSQLDKVNGQLAAMGNKSQMAFQNLSAAPPVGFNPGQWKNSNTTAFTGAGGQTVSVLNADAAAAANASKQAQVLQRAIASVSGEFRTSRQATRAYQEAVIQMGLELGQTDETFVAFDQEVGNSVNEINDLKAALKFQAEDGRALKSIVSIAQGIAGAFGAAQAAIALTGDETEETQKQMAKFQQVLVLINGLQAVNNTLEEENGAIQGVLAAKLFLTNTARKIQALFTEEAAVATGADTAANAANIASQEATAAAALETAGAMETEAGAAAAAEVATISFATAFIATGIGAIIVALGAGVAYLISKIPEWTASTQLNIKQQTELNNALAEQVQNLQKINDLRDAAGKRAVDDLQHQLDLEEKSGQNQYRIFAIKEKIAQKNQEIASDKYALALGQAEDKYVKQGLMGIDALHQAQTDYFEDLTDKTYKVSIVQKELDNALSMSDRERKSKGISDKDVDRIKERLDAAKAQQRVAEESYNYFVKAEEDKSNAEDEQENLRVEKAKFHEDEIRKYRLESAKLQSEAIAAANDRIINDERSTQTQIIAAMDANLKAQLEQIRTQKSILAEQFGKGDITQIDYQGQLLQLRHQELAAIDTTNEAKRKKNVEYWDRYLSALNDVNKTALETEANAAQRTADDVKLSLNQRLDAYEQYSVRQIALINADANFQKKKAGLTADELFDIEVRRQAKLQDLTMAGQLKRSQIVLSAIEAETKNLKDNSKLDALKDETKALDELDRQYRAGAISAEAFAKAKDKIANAAASSALEAQLVILKYIHGQLAKNGEDTKQIDLEIADFEKQLSNKKLDQDQKDADRKKQVHEAEIELARQTETTISSFIEGSFEREINRLQTQIDYNYKLKETETTRINASTLSETQKAASLQILNAQTEAQNEALQRKQRQEKQKEAEFDRAKAIFDVGANTAVAVIKAVAESPLTGGLPFSAIAAAIGAAQIAAILAKPIPKYAVGIDHSPEGLAVVGEKGPEMRIDPSGKVSMTPGQPTLTYLEEGTRIIPAHEVNQMLFNEFMASSSQFVQPNHNEAMIREIRDLKDTIRQTSQAQLAALRKQKAPTINIHNDAAFWAHIQNSCN